MATGLGACVIAYFAFLPPMFSWEGKDLHALVSAPVVLLVSYLVGRIHDQYRRLADLLNKKISVSQQELESVSKLYEQTLSLEDLGFRDFAESLPQIVWVTNPEGENIYFNQKWMDYTGMTLEKSMGHGWNLPFHPDDQERAWKAWQNAVQRYGIYSLECRLRRADGEYCWWLIRGVPLINSEGKIVKWFGTCTDINEIKITEEVLASQKIKLETIFKNHPDGVAIIDKNGSFEAVNQNYVNFYGHASIGDFPKTFAELIQGFEAYDLNDRPVSLAEMPAAKALAGHAVNNVEIRLVDRQSGRQRYGSISANPLHTNHSAEISGAIVSVRDITANIRDKAELVKLVNEQNLMLTSGIAGIAKTRDRVYVRVNEVFARNFGYAVDELIGKSTQILYDKKEDFDSFGKQINTAASLEGGGGYALSSN